MDNTILAKYIFNEANAQERATVEAWLAENPERAEELALLRDRLDLAARRYRPGTFIPGHARRARRRHLVLRYAAAAVVILLVGLWLWIPAAPPKVVLACPAGQIKQYYLPDSSVVTLSGPAELAYTPRYNKHRREVTMTGKVFFNVRKNLEKTFIVHSPAVDVRVLGTAFQVRADSSRAEIIVERGRVKVSAREGELESVLSGGMSATYVTGDAALHTSETSDINKIGWKTGYFRFHDTALGDVIRELNRYYRVNITLPDEYRSLRITVTFDKLPLEEALEIINQTFDLDLPAPASPAAAE